jgi:hypothetical protein
MKPEQRKILDELDKASTPGPSLKRRAAATIRSLDAERQEEKARGHYYRRRMLDTGCQSRLWPALEKDQRAWWLAHVQEEEKNG